MAICYKDITFCARKCRNIKCKRNMKHAEKAPLHGLPLSMCDYSDCKEWEGEDKNNRKEEEQND